jgi:hypothetical protein
MNFLIAKKQVQFANPGKRFAEGPRDVRNLIPPSFAGDSHRDTGAII